MKKYILCACLTLALGTRSVGTLQLSFRTITPAEAKDRIGGHRLRHSRQREIRRQ
jgi:hypothetical protein